MSSQHGHWLPAEQVIKAEAAVSLGLCDPASRGALGHFLNSRAQRGKGTTQGRKYQEATLVGQLPWPDVLSSQEKPEILHFIWKPNLTSAQFLSIAQTELNVPVVRPPGFQIAASELGGGTAGDTCGQKPQEPLLDWRIVSIPWLSRGRWESFRSKPSHSSAVRWGPCGAEMLL